MTRTHPTVAAAHLRLIPAIVAHNSALSDNTISPNRGRPPVALPELSLNSLRMDNRILLPSPKTRQAPQPWGTDLDHSLSGVLYTNSGILCPGGLYARPSLRGIEIATRDLPNANLSRRSISYLLLPDFRLRRCDSDINNSLADSTWALRDNAARFQSEVETAANLAAPGAFPRRYTALPHILA